MLFLNFWYEWQLSLHEICSSLISATPAWFSLFYFYWQTPGLKIFQVYQPLNWKIKHRKDMKDGFHSALSSTRHWRRWWRYLLYCICCFPLIYIFPLYYDVIKCFLYPCDIYFGAKVSYFSVVSSLFTVYFFPLQFMFVCLLSASTSSSLLSLPSSSMLYSIHIVQSHVAECTKHSITFK